jgi:glycosyltransferase involved in cell wall biosynthesis
MKILALMKYGERAASTRQRLLQYRGHLLQHGIEVEFSPLLTNEYLDSLFSGKPAPLVSILRMYAARAKLLLSTSGYDLLWVHCEIFPYLPGFCEQLATASGKPLVYDFDDAIFHQYDAHPSAFVRHLLGRKLQPLMRSTSLCLCGNEYLKAYAERFSPRAEILPTVLDTNVYTPRPSVQDATKSITVGWIGSPSTWSFVEPIVPMLRRVAENFNLTIRIVGARKPDPIPSRFEFIDWSEEEEVALIQGMDIGIMPLPEEAWARGKCGYKLIQYMACGIPVVASPVGVNSDIVDDGINGYLARSEHDWESAIERLVGNAEIRAAFGARGRAKIVSEYSLQAHGPRLARMLEEIALVFSP